MHTLTRPTARQQSRHVAMAGASIGLSANLTSILAWTVLPSFLANTLLTLFYRLSPSSRSTVPLRASPADLARAQERSQAHHRRARVLLVAAYLAYSVLSVYVAQQRGTEQNYYALLGLPRAVVEAEGASALKSHWRRLARVYHPDKVGKDGEAFFVLLRRGVEVLEHEGRRWAYERFGPGVTEWGKLVTPREFLVKGAVNSAMWWTFAAASLAVFSFFRKSERRFNFVRSCSLDGDSLSLSHELTFCSHAVALPVPLPLRLARVPPPHAFDRFAKLLLRFPLAPPLRARRPPTTNLHLGLDGHVAACTTPLASTSDSVRFANRRRSPRRGARRRRAAHRLARAKPRA